MSNNGKVEYDGDSWFFTYEDSNKVDQIKKNHHVNLLYQTEDMLFIECIGKGEIVKDKTNKKFIFRCTSKYCLLWKCNLTC